MSEGIQPEIGITKAFASWIAGLRFEHLPDEAVLAARRCFVDYVGLAVRGADLPAVQRAQAMLDTWYPGQTGAARVLGKERVLPPPLAALLLGITTHSLEMDDFHKQSATHPAVTIISAASAVAGLGSIAGKGVITGQNLLTAIAAGYEVAIRTSQAANPRRMQAKGFHPTPVCGVLGAAAAACSLLGLDERQTAHALGIAASFASGLGEWRTDGSGTKVLQVGRAAEGGVTAALMAASGLTGPTTGLEGKLGWASAYAGPTDWAEALAGLGHKFHIVEVGFKLYASCRYTHSGLDAILALKPDYRRVRKIRIGMATEMYRGVMWPEARKYKPETIVDAQFSMPFCAALALRRGRVSLEDFTFESIADTELLALAARVEGYIDPESDAAYPQENRSQVDILTDEGSFTQVVGYPSGDLENPADEAALKAKFMHLVGAVQGAEQAEIVYQRAIAVASLDSLSALFNLAQGISQ